MGLLATIKSWFHGLKAKHKIAAIKWQPANHISYRFATFADIPELLLIEKELFTEVPWTYMHFQQEIVSNHRAAFLLAERSNEILGYIGFRWNWKNTDCHVSNFIVRKSAQNQGLGSQLFQKLEEITEQLEIDKISLEVNVDNKLAQNFYDHRAFKVRKVLKNYYQNGDDAIFMEKLLREELGLEYH